MVCKNCVRTETNKGRYSGYIAMHATLASRDVDLCLIPEVPFYMDGSGGLLEFAKQRLRENGHMVIVVAEGAGQELMAESMGSLDKLSDASGNRLLLDVGLWLCQHLKDHFVKEFKEPLNLKYIGKLMPYLCFGNFLGSCRK
jgi:6-phosphofructokinase 1